MPGPAATSVAESSSTALRSLLNSATKSGHSPRRAFRRYGEGRHPAGLNFGDPEAARIAAAARASVAQTMEGKTVVVSGTVPDHNREEAETAITSRGGKSPGSVSKKTFALVVGAGAGASKLTKAEALGTPIVPAERFADFLADPEAVVAELAELAEDDEP